MLKKKGGTKMTTEDLLEKLDFIRKIKCETSSFEIKSSEQECPKHLYDSLMSIPDKPKSPRQLFYSE